MHASVSQTAAELNMIGGYWRSSAKVCRLCSRNSLT